MTNIWSINTLFIIALIVVFHTSASVNTYVEAAKHPTHLRSNSIANANSNSNNRSGSNGGIYFSDSPLLNDAEGSADGPDDDLDDNASGKGEDDEDTKDIIDKEVGSGSGPNMSGPDHDTDDDEDSDDDLDDLGGSGDDSLPFIPPTQRPELTPEEIKPSVTPLEPKINNEESEAPPNREKLPDLDNRVPNIRPETTPRYINPPQTPSTPYNEDENGLDNAVSIMGQKQVTPASFFARPGILAAVIGGAVVGLLCAILLVMFIVYRMRKKDEGSYALDEHKRTTSANPYARGASKELYA